MILTLIQALFKSKVELPGNPKFYMAVIKEVEFHFLAPQIHHLLLKTGQFENTPVFFQVKVKHESDKAFYQNVMIKTHLKRIFDAFEEHGIQVIPLKGVSFIEKYFGSLGARWTSDIDLLIEPSDKALAMQCIKSLGFQDVSKFTHFHISLSKEIPNSTVPLTVELHWNVLIEETTHLNISEFWNQAKSLPSYKFVKELSNYHTFYMICLHGWRHHLNSLKYFLDIVQLIHVLKEDLDYTVLWKDAKTHQNLRRIRRTLTIVYHFFPHLEENLKLPSKTRAPIWWEYQSIRDLNDKRYKQYLNLLQFKYLDFDSYSHSLYTLINWMFPASPDLIHELNGIPKGNSYIELYKQRGSKFIKLITRWVGIKYEIYCKSS